MQNCTLPAHRSMCNVLLLAVPVPTTPQSRESILLMWGRGAEKEGSIHSRVPQIFHERQVLGVQKWSTMTRVPDDNLYHRQEKPFNPYKSSGKWLKWCWRVVRTNSKGLGPSGPGAKFSVPFPCDLCFLSTLDWAVGFWGCFQMKLWGRGRTLVFRKLCSLGSPCSNYA